MAEQLWFRISHAGEADYIKYLDPNVYAIDQYSTYVRKVIGWPRAAAQLVTDLDLSRDPGMYIQRSLAYTFYPLDLRGVRGGHPEYDVFFMSRKAHSGKNEYEWFISFSPRTAVGKRRAGR
ncbi:MAG: hypothetical protein ACLFPX_03430 [Candidatus Omnitrophota bacterium]